MTALRLPPHAPSRPRRLLMGMVVVCAAAVLIATDCGGQDVDLNITANYDSLEPGAVIAYTFALDWLPFPAVIPDADGGSVFSSTTRKARTSPSCSIHASASSIPPISRLVEESVDPALEAFAGHGRRRIAAWRSMDAQKATRSPEPDRCHPPLLGTARVRANK